MLKKRAAIRTSVWATTFFLLVAVCIAPHAAYAAGWYNNSWLYRAAVTVQHAQVGGSLTDFPVYVNLNTMPAGFWSAVRSDCGDIRVTTGDGTTEVPREMVTCNTGAQTGELHFKAPSLSAAVDAGFYIYYGNAGAADYTANATYGAQNVWDTNYKGVWHMKDGSTLSAADSTANSNNGSILTPSATAGQVDGAGSYNGSSDRIKLTKSASLNVTSAWTLEAWVFPSSAPSGVGVISESYNGTDGTTVDSDVQYELGYGMDEGPGGSSKLKIGFFDGTWRLAQDGSNVVTGQWYQIAGSWDGTTLSLYRNGSSVTTNNPGGASPAGQGGVFIGERHDSAGSVNFFPGKIDEVRISGTARPLAWLSSEYNNQNAPASFYTAGSQESQNTPARILRLKGGVRLIGGVRLR